MIKKNLVLGIGNMARRDDGVGVHVVNYLMDSGINIPENVELRDTSAAVHDTLPVMAGYKKIVIVDAARADDNRGSVYRIPSEKLKTGYWDILKLSTHLREVLFQFFILTPDVELDLVGVVPEDVYSCSIELSELVKKSLHKAAQECLKAASE